MGEDRSTPEMARYTVAEAADMLGISTGAVRNRLSRGTLRSVKEGGTVYVLLSPDMPRDVKRDVADTPGGIPHPEPDALTSELRDRLRYVEEQLEAERQARAEARRLLMAALERIPPQLEAPQEARESPQTVKEEPERAEPGLAASEAQESAASSQQRGSWRAPVDKLHWWQYLLGLLTVVGTAGAISSPYLYARVSAFFGGPVIAAIVELLLFWAVPGTFGFWVGLKRKNLSLLWHLVPVGAIAGILAGLAAFPETARGTNAALGLATGVVVPTLVFYVSGATIGRALQRRSADEYASLTPDTEPAPSARRSTTPGDSWSPRKQAMLGFAGAIIAALISLVGTMFSVMMSGG